MTEATLGFLFRDGKIILAKKKRKIGVGKWNGYGGKVDPGEDRISSLVRETYEESGLLLEKEKCRELGYMDFVFPASEKSMRVFIYRIDEFSGFPVETEEMGEAKEFDLSRLPYEEMMLGDDKFMPYVLEGSGFTGVMHFNPTGDEILLAEIEKVSQNS